MKLLRPLLLLLLPTTVCTLQTTAQLAATNPATMQAFPLQAVRLLPGVFKDAQETDLQYILQLKPDRLLAPFLREAGIPLKDSSYGNWENTGLDGHIGGHYLSALSNMYAATGNSEVLARLHYMLDWLDSCQQHNGNGYIGGVPGSKALWTEVAAGKINANSFSLNGRWVPWYNMHKLYAGLLDAYTVAGMDQAKRLVTGLSDWCLQLTQSLSDEQMQRMLAAEHGGMNEVFANVAAITGDKKYLALAYRFSHSKILHPLMMDQDSLTGLHANTQIPKVVGFERMAEISGDTTLSHAAGFFWQTVVQHRSVSVGGNSVSEHFNPSNDFSSMIQSREGIETCNSYNMLRLTKALFLQQPSVNYLDYYERTVYNHILSSQHPQGGFVYFTPMRPSHYRVYSQPQRDFWCCVGTGLENHGKYGELIYSWQGSDLYVNLFMASQLRWEEQGITVTQQTRFPYEPETRLSLQLKQSKTFTVFIRLPHWLAAGAAQIWVNDQPVAITAKPGAYAGIHRKWANGDRIRVKLPMHTTAERLPDGSDWVSFAYGPIVLAAATDTAAQEGMRGDGSRMGHVAKGPLYPIANAPLLVTHAKDPATVIAPTDPARLTFHTTNALYPASYSDMQLTPFFSLYDTRYILYWPLTTPEGLARRQQEIKEREQALLALEKITVDQVAAGEQQPETDHRFSGQQTETGSWNDRHYRRARGWFSYILKDAAGKAQQLRVTYSGKDAGNHFDILVNGVLLQAVTLENRANGLYDVAYPLPAAAKSAELTIRFAAHPGSVAGSVYHIRLTTR